jgi:hypothetical protein
LNDGLFSPQWAVPTAPSILFHHQRARRRRVRIVRRKAAGPEVQCGCRVSKSLVDNVLLQEYHRFWPNPTSSHWSHCNCSPQVVHDEELVLNILPTCTRTGCSLVVPVNNGKAGEGPRCWGHHNLPSEGKVDLCLRNWRTGFTEIV